MNSPNASPLCFAEFDAPKGQCEFDAPKEQREFDAPHFFGLSPHIHITHILLTKLVQKRFRTKDDCDVLLYKFQL